MSTFINIEESVKKLKDYYNKRKDLLELYKSKNPAELRQKYDDLIRGNNNSILLLNNTTAAMDSIFSIQKNIFDESNTIINNTMNIDKEITALLNKYQVGTLQGIARQTVVDNRIEPNQDDIVAQAVLTQPYDEREDINRNENTGGRKRKRKTNKKSRKTNKKSRKNKY